MHTVTLEEAKTRLPELVQEVQAGAEVLIVPADSPAVKLIPAMRPGFGDWKGRVVMADDFDAPLDHFADYIDSETRFPNFVRPMG